MPESAQICCDLLFVPTKLYCHLCDASYPPNRDAASLTRLTRIRANISQLFKNIQPLTLRDSTQKGALVSRVNRAIWTRLRSLHAVAR